METLELQKEIKEESDEEDDDDEESGRLRFKTERKEGTIIRLSDVTRERRNIPETLGNFFFCLSSTLLHSHFNFLRSTVMINQIGKTVAFRDCHVCHSEVGGLCQARAELRFCESHSIKRTVFWIQNIRIKYLCFLTSFSFGICGLALLSVYNVVPGWLWEGGGGWDRAI